MANTESAKEFLGSDFEKYRQTLNLAIRSDESYLDAINQYVVGRRGKEIRPVLSLLAGKASGILSSENYHIAAATEMLHTATLMHDDVADAANMRRGALSVSAMFSAGAAVLTGDFWLARSLDVLIRNCSHEILSNFTMAIQKMSEAELLQLDKADSLDTTEEDYFKIIYGKTAAIFCASLKSAALAAGADQERTDAIVRYAKNIGLAFQVRDDIIDYTPSLKAGKLPGADLKERKITLPLLGAFANCPRQESRIKSRIREIVNVFNGKFTKEEEDIVAEVSAFVLENGGIEYSTRKMEELSSDAVRSLSVLPDSEAKNLLADFAVFVGRRDA